MSAPHPTVYGTSPVKRQRRSKRELERLDEALYRIVEEQHPITVRGAYYQAEVRGLVPKTDSGYDVVQRRLVILRRNQVVPYGWITDGTRLVRSLRRWDGLEAFATEAARIYKRDYWAHSEVRVEIWIEKDALAGVIYPIVVQEWGLDLWVARGFSSVTYLQNAADAAIEDGRQTYVYVLGDFDPSGYCAAQTIMRELPARAEGVDVHVKHLAITDEQVSTLNIPTRPIKRSDSRAARFEAEFGPVSAELDAIRPTQLRALVDGAIRRHADVHAIQRLRGVEEAERRTLKDILGSLAEGGGA
jgi:hypothetical protein